MTPAMIAALAAERAQVTGFLDIAFPSGTRRMMLGAGEVAWGANTYKGFDPTFGTIVGGDDLREDTSGEAPNTILTVEVAPTATRSDIASKVVQLAEVKIYLAALQLDGSNKLVAIADPELLATGFIDQAVSGLDARKDQVDYTIISAFDYFFEDSEGQRLNGPFHKSVWTGELGLDNVTGVTRKIYWGTYGPGAGGVGQIGGGAQGGVTSFVNNSLVSV